MKVAIFNDKSERFIGELHYKVKIVRSIDEGRNQY